MTDARVIALPLSHLTRDDLQQTIELLQVYSDTAEAIEDVTIAFLGESSWLFDDAMTIYTNSEETMIIPTA